MRKQEELIRKLKMLRKKRLKMNMINHILFGDNVESGETSLSDNEEYGSSANLKDE